MQPLKSSILLVGLSVEQLVDLAADIGADVVQTIEAATRALEKNPHAVQYSVVAVVATDELLQELITFAKLIQGKKADVQLIVVHHQLAANKLQKIANEIAPFKILSVTSEFLLHQTIQEALERHSLLQQNLQLINLINEQNERLKKLSLELESRIEKRQKYLTNAREKLLISNFRIEALHRALVAVHQADSVGDLEELLNRALAEAFQLSWIRILFHQQNFFEQQAEMNRFQFEIFSAPLVQGRDHIGQIYFSREKQNPFRKDEHNFLIQVSDAVALAIDRLNHLEQSKTLKHQWEATFDAITTPLSLVSSDYRILRCNQAFAAQSAIPIQKLIGQTCYSTFFHRKSPCPQCHLGESFRLTPQKTGRQTTHTFEVSSQRLEIPITEEQSYVVLYRDVSDQQKWERQLLESAKMAEIGTISSSIAHELNNPLGGMLSFLQLIKSDLQGGESYYEEILEMERGVQSCREIVQNLLVYSRRPSLDQIDLIDLKDVLSDGIKLTELQTKSMGIEFNIQFPQQETRVRGQKNLLTQAFRHLLQSINNSLTTHMNEHPSFQGQIIVVLQVFEDSFLVEIKTNLSGANQKVGLSTQSELTLTVTNQIIEEHSGTLEVFSQEEKKFHYRVALPRP
mgnify:CR=1 FL=1